MLKSTEISHTWEKMEFKVLLLLCTVVIVFAAENVAKEPSDNSVRTEGNLVTQLIETFRNAKKQLHAMLNPTEDGALLKKRKKRWLFRRGRRSPPPPPCARNSVNCQNGANCLDVNSERYMCDCPNGFSGEYCEIEIDECVKMPCRNQGVCIDKVDGFSCECSSAYSGKYCEIDRNPCRNYPCQHGGNCRNEMIDEDWDSVAHCDCPVGFTGRHCEINHDECISQPCKHGGRCIDKNNAFVCECPPGYYGVTCQLLSSCPQITVAPDSFALNPKSNYSFKDVVLTTCEQGFEVLSGELTRTCQADGTWSGLPAICKEKNECSSTPCTNGGVCIDEVDGYQCECTRQFEGTHCQSDKDDCSPNPCLNNGICIDEGTKYRCECPPGVTGFHCHIDINECKSNPCKNGGSCVDELDGYKCACRPGYIGIHCELNVDECHSSPCRNDGTCLDGVDFYRCVCKNGFTGNYCEQPICCGDPPTIHHGHVITQTSSCADGKTGYDCSPGYKMNDTSALTCGPLGYWEGNLPFCQIDTKCYETALVSPGGGYKVCGGDVLSAFCYMHCNAPKQYVAQHDVFECNSDTKYEWKYQAAANKYLPAQVLQCKNPQLEDPFAVVRTSGLKITSVNPPNEEALRMELEKKLRKLGLCKSPCRLGKLVIEKGALKLHLRKRSALNYYDVQIELIGSATQEMISQHGTIQKAWLAIGKQLTDSAELLRLQLKLDDFDLTIDGERVRLIDSGMTISRPSLGCPSGSIKKGAKCFECPAGSYHDIWQDLCESCPIATYQNIAGRTECTSCPEGTTTEGLGSTNKSLCIAFSDCNCGIHPCEKTSAGYACECLPGYKLSNGICVDIDECLLPNSCPNGVCVNRVGSYVCKCLVGYHGSPCIDLDECQFRDACSDHLRMTCINTEGSYHCTCRPGYYGANCDEICPKHTILAEKSCILYSPELANYTESATACNDTDILLNGRLAAVKDKAIYKFLARYGEKDTSYWIGLDDIRTPGTFVHSDGTVLNVASGSHHEWAPGRPGSHPLRRCVIMNYQKAYMWDNVDCSEKHKFICQSDVIMDD